MSARSTSFTNPLDHSDERPQSRHNLQAKADLFGENAHLDALEEGRAVREALGPLNS